jgi:DNA invertase Pin-like site-specific DNA recombinase
MVTMTEVMSKERLDSYIDEAARLAEYKDGFGVSSCDLSRGNWWAVYTRQSTREQAENDRLNEYLLTCARLARQNGVIVPREYIIYDSVTSEHFDRPGIKRLRSELIAGRHIEGVIIPAQGRLSMDPHHQLTFEKECQYYGVQIIYGDAPGGNDWGSQTTRLIQAQANALRVKTNRDNALSGNISRIMTGKVPAQRAPYGYLYKANKVIEERTGKARVLSAKWEINEIDLDNELLWGSSAWVVSQMFYWLGVEGRTQYWVTAELNRLGIQPIYGPKWAPKMVSEIVKRPCYTGKATYNANKRVPNPERPLGDLTLGVKRTILRPKAESEKIIFNVPPLTTEELWQRANDNLRERGRGRGKQGKKIQALFRGRMMCPVCGKPMAVMRRKNGRIYYYCRDHYNKWKEASCQYNKFVPLTWDGEIWKEICELFSNNTWIEQQLATELNNSREIEKLIRLQELKINNYQNRVRKVGEGFEGGLYTLEEAKSKKQKNLEAIKKAQTEIDALKKQIGVNNFNPDNIKRLRLELKNLQNRNLEETSFEERLDLVARLGIKVYPLEDLKSRRIKCGVDIRGIQKLGEQDGFTKVVYGSAYRIRTGDLLLEREVS